MIAVLVGALAVLPMVLDGPGGEPIMTAADWAPAPVQDVSGVVGASARTAFRWRNADGYWQFSDVRPEGVADDRIQSFEIAQAMTLPSAGFTSDRQSGGTQRVTEPVEMRLSQPTTARTSADAQAMTTEDALAEIAARHPGFKALSDALTRSAADTE